MLVNETLLPARKRVALLQRSGNAATVERIATERFLKKAGAYTIFLLCLWALINPVAARTQLLLPAKEEAVTFLTGAEAKPNNLPHTVHNSYDFDLPAPDEYRPRIALALSGGGARGIAQIGVLKKFEEAGIPIDYIVGTSMGAIVGGLYAAGYSGRELDSIVTTVDWQEIFAASNERDRADQFLDQKIDDDRSLMTLRFQDLSLIVPEAISTGYRFTSLINRLVWDGLYHANGNFDNLKTPFRAIATDLAHGASVALRDGDLATAMRASATVPLRFTPIKIDSMVLVDGGIMSNVPVHAALEFQPDIVIAVNTTSPLLTSDELNTPWNIADQVVTVMMRRESEKEKALADFVIEPRIGAHSAAVFSGIDSLIAAGERAVELALPEIRALLQRKRDSTYQHRFVSPATAMARVWQGHSVTLEGFHERDSLALYRRLKQPSSDIVAACLNSWSGSFPYQSIGLEFREYIDRLDTAFSINVRGVAHPVIHDISLFGIASVAADSLEESLSRAYSGSVGSPDTLRMMTEDIMRWYRHRGHSLAHVIAMDYDADNGAIRIGLDEGIIRSISIVGAKSTSESAIISQLELREGEPFHSQKATKGWRQLMNTKLFSEVTIEAQHRADGPGVDVVARINERGSQILRLGMRIDNERNTQLGLDLVEENFFSSGLRASLRLAGGLRNQDATFTISAPRILPSGVIGSMSLYTKRRKLFRYRNREDFSALTFERLRDGEDIFERFGATASIAKLIERNGNLRAGIRFERQRSFTDLQRADKPDFESLATLELNARFDTQDRADFPTEGRVISLAMESSVLNLENDVKFSKAVVQMESAISFNAHTLLPRVFFGFADRTLPETEQFELGGQDLFYGMRENEERGRQLALASLEYRVESPLDIFFDTYISARYDLGSTWSEPTQIKISQLRHGLGIGIALDSPLGPAQVALGKSFFFLKDPSAVMRGPLLAYFSIGMKI